MSYQKPNDPMAKTIIVVGSLVLIATVVVLLMSLLNTVQRNTIAADTIVDTSEIIKPEVAEKVVSKAEAVANANIKPIGAIDLSAPVQTAAANTGPRSGEDIYNTTCTACHGTGVLESPKLGDRAAWLPRLAAGFDTLLASSIAGKGAMPPKGGNASLSESEMKATIIYMLDSAGIDAGVSVDAPAQKAAPAPAAESKESAPKATEVTAPEVTADAPVEAAATTTETAPKQPAAPAQAVAPEAPKQPAAPEVSATAEVASAPAAFSDSMGAEALYKEKCVVCHAAGVAGAPIFANKEQWAPRIAQGKEVLYSVAMNGKGAMPPKGTANDSSEAEIKAVVDYMVRNAQ